MANFLYGLTANNPIILSAVSLLIVLIVLLACYTPHAEPPA
jgi:hypothetical protein